MADIDPSYAPWQLVMCNMDLDVRRETYDMVSRDPWYDILDAVWVPLRGVVNLPANITIALLREELR